MRRRLALALGGVLLLAATSASATIRINEMALGCDADTSASFVELSMSGEEVFSNRVGLQVLDRGGAVVHDIAAIFGRWAGDNWIAGRTYLVGGTGFSAVTGSAPNVATPLRFDPVRGRLVLYRLEANNTRTTLGTLAYGGPGESPAPPVGTSLVRTTSGYSLSSPPTPTPYERFQTPPAAIPFCYEPSTIWQIRQFATACSTGSLAGGFVEIEALTSVGILTQNLTLVVRDRFGATTETALDLLANRRGQPLSDPRRLTIVAPGFVTPAGASADDTLSTVLDPVGGGFALLRVEASGQSTVMDAIDYGPSAPVNAPTAGQSQKRQPNGLWGPDSSPDPVNFAAQPMWGGPCPYVPPPLPFLTDYRIEEFGLRCETGSSAGFFLEIGASGPDSAMASPSVRVRIANENDVPVLYSGLGFPRVARLWPAGARWLVGDPGFAALTGLAPDAGLTWPSPRSSGSITLYDIDTGEVFDVLRFGYGNHPPAPRDGRSLVRIAEDQWASSDLATPTRLDGASLSPTRCYPAAHPRRIALEEVFTQCLDGNSSRPFVELVALDTVRLANAWLRVRDRASTVTYFGPAPFGALESQTFTGGRRWLARTYGSSTALHSLADALLPVTLDPSGGAVELLDDPNGAPLDVARWGTGGVLLARGQSLQRTAQGYASATPSPTNSRGESLPGPDQCFGGCGFGWFTVYDAVIRAPLGGAALDTTLLGDRVVVDPANGRVVTQATGHGGEAYWLAAYTVTGVPPGTEVKFEAVVRTEAEVITGSCGLPPCGTSASTVLLQVIPMDPAFEASYGVPIYGDRELRAKVRARAGDPIQFGLYQNGIPFGGGGRVNATSRLHFEGLPAGATITSCRGYVSDGIVGAPAAPIAFALHGVRPNPLGGAGTLAFALDRTGDVRADVLDIAGRRVLERRWTLAAGEHVMPLARAGELRPGVYLVRLTHADRTLTTRAIVVR